MIRNINSKYINKNMHNFKLKELRIRKQEFLKQESNMITKKERPIQEMSLSYQTQLL
jgi:hypothetical protein